MEEQDQSGDLRLIWRSKHCWSNKSVDLDGWVHFWKEWIAKESPTRCGKLKLEEQEEEEDQ